MFVCGVLTRNYFNKKTSLLNNFPDNLNSTLNYTRLLTIILMVSRRCLILQHRYCRLLLLIKNYLLIINNKMLMVN